MTVGSDSNSAIPDHSPVSILDHFADLPDPRREQGRIHRLDEIVFMATCAVFCGADTWVQIADYGHSKRDWLQTFLTLPGGIPRTTPSDVSSVSSTRWPFRRASPPGSRR